MASASTEALDTMIANVIEAETEIATDINVVTAQNRLDLMTSADVDTDATGAETELERDPETRIGMARDIDDTRRLRIRRMTYPYLMRRPQMLLLSSHRLRREIRG